MSPLDHALYYASRGWRVIPIPPGYKHPFGIDQWQEKATTDPERIHVGDQYLEQVISPDHGDVGNAGWWRASECRACAVRYARWPIPNGAVIQR